MTVANLVFYLAAAAAVATGYLVFRTDSMVRAAFFLLASFLAAGVVVLLLEAEFLFVITVLMMTGEMTIMAVFMVMFMMNPGGLQPMAMVHLSRFAPMVGIVAFAGLAGAILTTDFAVVTADPPPDVPHDLGLELLGPSMLVFETAGLALLTTMIAAVALTSKRGRFGQAIEAHPERHGGAEREHDGDDGDHGKHR